MSLSPGKLVRALTERWLGPRRTLVQVTIRDQDFRIVRVLASEHDIAAFSSLWAARIKVDYRSWVRPPTHHKLDIRWRERGGRMRSYRWLYRTVIKDWDLLGELYERYEIIPIRPADTLKRENAKTARSTVNEGRRKMPATAPRPASPRSRRKSRARGGKRAD